MVRRIPIWAAYRAENRSVGAPDRCDIFRPQRNPELVEGVTANRQCLELELMPVAALDRGEDLDRLSHDVRSDSVAGEQRNSRHQPQFLRFGNNITGSVRGATSGIDHCKTGGAGH